MAGRSLARLLAPLALVTFVVALYVVVTASNRDGPSTQATETRSTDSSAPGDGSGSNGKARRTRGRRTYTVKPGDTPSTIAEKTGVPLSQIQRLNPDLDPQTLQAGTRLRLRQ
jgi:LysM repeat protein